MNPSRQQIRIDYEREQRERRQLVWAVSHKRTGLTACKWNNVQQVLVFLINSDRGDGKFPYVDTIVRVCSLSRSTVNRAIADAKSLGILTAERTTNKRGRGHNEWSIHFAAVAALGRSAGTHQPQDGTNQCQDETNQSQDGTNSYKGFN